MSGRRGWGSLVKKEATDRIKSGVLSTSNPVVRTTCLRARQNRPIGALPRMSRHIVRIGSPEVLSVDNRTIH